MIDQEYTGKNLKSIINAIIPICLLFVFITSCAGTSGSKGILAFDNTRINSLNIEAKKYYEEALRYSRKNRPEEAIEAYSRSILADPSAAAYNGRCVEYNRTGRYDRAVADANRAIMMSPGYPAPYQNRGNALYMLKSYDEALKSYQRAIRLNPADPECYFNLGQTYFRKGLFGDAMASYNKTIELDPHHRFAWYNRACIASLKKDLSAAMESLEKAVDEGFDNAERMRNEPALENVRSLPGFSILVSRIERAKKQPQ